jgi:hypothetical protein
LNVGCPGLDRREAPVHRANADLRGFAQSGSNPGHPTAAQSAETTRGRSFPPGVDTGCSVFVEIDANHIRTTTYGAVFDVLLLLPGGGVDWNHDLLAARIAHVTRLGFD